MAGQGDLQKTRSIPWPNVFAYAAAPMLSALALFYFMRLSSGDLDIPYAYWGDALVYSSWIKGIIENGWWLENPRLGAPFGQILHDFPYPASATLQVLILKLLGFFLHSHWAVHNAYFLLTFPMAAFFAFFSLKRLKVTNMSALMGSVIFSFLPYHFFHGMFHLFSSGYYLIPIAVLICVRIMDGPALDNASGYTRLGLPLKLRRQTVGMIIASIFIGMTDIHYSFFACYLFLVSAAMGTMRWRTFHSLGRGFVAICTVTTVLALNMIPTLLYYAENGRNPSVARRGFHEADIYGLRISQLLLPVDEHRINVARHVKETYNRSIPQNENRFVSLGAFAGAGFLVLLFWLLCARCTPESHGKPIMDSLSTLNGAALLLGTIGGFGALFALVISPQIRVYNRISVYIGFVSIAATCMVLDWGARKISSRFFRKGFTLMMCPVILGLALLDQTTPSFIPDYKGNRISFLRDKDFVQRIETELPQGSMVFQLPYFPFPEAGPVKGIADYEPLRFYLHSNHLRWSYGAIKGRLADLWQRQQLSQSYPNFFKRILLAGFAGLVVDRRGFEDSEIMAMESGLRQVCGDLPMSMVDERGFYLFYALEECRRRFIALYPEATIEKSRRLLLHPVYSWWAEGCYEEEALQARSWRWCRARSVLELLNPMDSPQKIVLSFKALIHASRNHVLTMEGDLINQVLNIGPNGVDFSRELEVPPGGHRIVFETDAPRVAAPKDPRVLNIRFEDFQCRAAEPLFFEVQDPNLQKTLMRMNP